MIVQIATWESATEALERGGGFGPTASPSVPATTVTSMAWPWASWKVRRGTVGAHSIVKCGSHIFCAAGRLIQIWKSSSGFGRVCSRSGNISAWTIPAPAVIH